MGTHVLSDLTWERMWRAVEKVRRRLARATDALDKAAIPYAVAGDIAVAAWIAEVDEAAVRSTPDIEILLRRADLQGAKLALCAAGFVHLHSSGIDTFLDGPDAKARDAVRVVFAGEKIGTADAYSAPDVSMSKTVSSIRVLELEPLVCKLLASFKLIHRVNVRDMIDVGLVDQTWVARLPKELGARLQQLLDTPEG